MAGRSMTAAVLLAATCLAAGPLAPRTPAREPKKPEAATVKAVRDLATDSVKEFEAGNASKAIDLMQQAIAIMQKALTANLAAFLPAAPDGWVAGEVEQEAMAATAGAVTQWTHVSRDYTRKSDDQKVRIELSNSPTLVQVQAAMWQTYQNPMLLAMVNQDPNTQITVVKDRDGWSGYTTVEKGNEAKTVLFISGCFLVVGVPGGNAALVEQFLGLMKLKEMSTALATPAPAPAPTPAPTVPRPVP